MELSVFIDESGDFGDYSPHSPYYIIQMIFHDQKDNISEELKRFGVWLNDNGLNNVYMHAGPLIRREEDFKNMSMIERRKILSRLIAFARAIKITQQGFLVEKRHLEDPVQISLALSKQIAGYLREHYPYFLKFSTIKIYYDNGQIEVTKIITSVFSALFSNVEFRKISPQNYRLSQMADLFCALRLEEEKLKTNTLSKSELSFFQNKRILKKNYLNLLNSKSL